MHLKWACAMSPPKSRKSLLILAIKASGTAPSEVVATLLERMGQYYKHVKGNYFQAISFLERALAIVRGGMSLITQL